MMAVLLLKMGNSQIALSSPIYLKNLL